MNEDLFEFMAHFHTLRTRHPVYDPTDKIAQSETALFEKEKVRAFITRSCLSNGRIYMITLYHKDDYFDPIYLELFIILATYGICGSLSASGPASMFQTEISNPET